MKYLSILLALAGASSAIDTLIHLDEKWCGGRWIGCLNLNPDTCCRAGQAGQSAQVKFIPKEWHIQARFYFNGDCNPAQETDIDASWRPTFVCQGQAGIQSIGYGFLGKRSISDGKAQEYANECQEPNAFGLGDGTAYDISAMDQGMVDALMSFDNATVKADLPEAFNDFILERNLEE